MKTIDIYTDGGCSGNPGPGGWAFIISTEKGHTSASGSNESTTNNRMELFAVIKSLEEIQKAGEIENMRIALHTDSEYVKKGITEWIKTWEKNGFLTASRTPVKNQDLWMLLKTLAEGLSIAWNWVKGHSGNELNEKCDRLVQARIVEIKRKA